MPIKYNLTKYDMLAEKIHELAQKIDTPFSNDEETLRAEATLIASFASSHSWQTYKTMTTGNITELNSIGVKNEYLTARSEKWRRIRNMDIQEVACTNIKDGLFYMWLSVNSDKANRELYRRAWIRLKEEFNEECDGISVQRQR